MENLNHLYTFYVVAQAGGLTQAANKLHLSPSAVSQSLKQMEAIAETPLIERSRRYFKITDAGQKLLATCRIMFSAYEAGIGALREKEAVAGELRISSSPYLATTWLPRQAAELMQNYPEMAIHITAGSGSAPLSDLLNLRADVALVAGFWVKSAEGISLHRTAFMRYLLAGHPDYFRRNGMPKKIADLASHTLIDVDESLPYLSTMQEKLGPVHNIPFRRKIYINVGLGVLEALHAGVGLAAVSYLAVKNELKQKRLKIALPHIAFGGTPFYICTLNHREELPKIRIAIDFLGKQLETILPKRENQLPK